MTPEDFSKFLASDPIVMAKWLAWLVQTGRTTPGQLDQAITQAQQSAVMSEFEQIAERAFGDNHDLSEFEQIASKAWSTPTEAAALLDLAAAVKHCLNPLPADDLARLQARLSDGFEVVLNLFRRTHVVGLGHQQPPERHLLRRARRIACDVRYHGNYTRRLNAQRRAEFEQVYQGLLAMVEAVTA